jgi:RNA polymerase-binding transcription factor DksA
LGSDAVEAGVSHYIGLIPVTALPDGITTANNLRLQNLGSPVAKRMRASLESNDGMFHLKNKGITMLASSVSHISDTSFAVIVDGTNERDGDGILDGGHTYKLIRQAINAGVDVSKQYVFVWLRVNVPTQYRAEMAEALNNSAAVSEASLANRRDEFGWMKTCLPADSVSNIAWQQNETDKRCKVEELIAQHYAVIPSYIDTAYVSYSSRAKTLSTYRTAQDAFRAHKALFLDTVRMYEYFQYAYVDDISARLGARALEKRARPYTPLLLPADIATNTRACRAIAMVLLGTMSSLVIHTVEGEAHFDRDFESLKRFYDSIWEDLLQGLADAWNSQDVAGDPGALGKRDKTWSTLKDIVRERMSLLTGERPELGYTSPRDRFLESQMIDLEELQALWSDLLTEKRNDHESLLNTARHAEQRDAFLLSSQLEASEHMIGRIECGIQRLASADFSLCQLCTRPIDPNRLLEPQFAYTCVNCSSR